MDTHRLRMKIGEHEFDAAGTAEAVQAQFATFTALMASVMNIALPGAHPPAQTVTPGPTADDDTAGAEQILMRRQGRMVSLTRRGATLEDNVLLVLLGQKMLRNNDAVSGAEIMTGLRQSGIVVSRVDYELDKMNAAGDVMMNGRMRGRRYWLTNEGLVKARRLAKSLNSQPSNS